MTTRRTFSKSEPGSSGSDPPLRREGGTPALSSGEAPIHAPDADQMIQEGTDEALDNAGRDISDALMESYNG